MVSFETVREIALSFEESEEAPHHEITSFVVKKKIFLTLNAAKQHITIRLTEVDQSIFCQYNPEIVFPVSSKWKKYGWTHINLLLVDEELLREVITLSYCLVAPKKFAAKYEVTVD